MAFVLDRADFAMKGLEKKQRKAGLSRWKSGKISGKNQF